MNARRRTLVALVALVLAGCAAAGPRPAESVPAATRGESLAPVDAEAPPECGFEPGTKLIYAGRSTTSLLQVQEVIGDPMSNDPADIYITFDEIDFGDGGARQVCAIYVDPPGFVELTLAPVGWDPETGRPSPTPPPLPEPEASVPAAVVTQDEAVAAALAIAPQDVDWEVATARQVPLQELELFLDTQEWSQDLAPNHPLWFVFVVHGDRGLMVHIDAATGEVLHVVEGIVN